MAGHFVAIAGYFAVRVVNILRIAGRTALIATSRLGALMVPVNLIQMPFGIRLSVPEELARESAGAARIIKKLFLHFTLKKTFDGKIFLRKRT